MAPDKMLPLALVFACNNAPIYEGTSASNPSTGDSSGSPTGDPSGPSTGDSSGSPTGDPSGPSTGDSSGNPTGDPSGPSTGDSSGSPTGDPSTGDACKLKLDIVFMLSRATGMQQAQTKLAQAAPVLFDTLANIDLDVRMMVVDMDPVFGAEECEDKLCPMSNSCAPLDESYPCGGTPTACDLAMGASIVYPIGIGASNKDCGFSPFLDAPDLNKLECAVLLGEGTPTVQIGDTVNALLGAANASCNGSFIRTDSIVALVIASNVDDTSFGNAAEWIGDVTSKRPLDSFVVASFTANAPEIDQFVAAFPFTSSASIDAADYGPTLAEVATLASNLCI